MSATFTFALWIDTTHGTLINIQKTLQLHISPEQRLGAKLTWSDIDRSFRSSLVLDHIEKLVGIGCRPVSFGFCNPSCAVLHEYESETTGKSAPIGKEFVCAVRF
jgi:hypothetical protein